MTLLISMILIVYTVGQICFTMWVIHYIDLLNIRSKLNRQRIMELEMKDADKV
jgi:hypothetical protein